jgi:hypothetical protein
VAALTAQVGAQHSNSAALRGGYLRTVESNDAIDSWAAAIDLYVNLTTRFGLGLGLGLNRFEQDDLTDKYYQTTLLLRDRENWGRVRPYVSGGGGLYLFKAGERDMDMERRPFGMPSYPSTRNTSSYSPYLGGNFGLGADFDILPGPLFLEGDLRGHLVLASPTNSRWFIASLGIGLDWMGKDPP